MYEYKWLNVPDENHNDAILMMNELGVDKWRFTGHIEDTGHSTKYLMELKI